MSDYHTLRTYVSDKVATIWLNRPERRNSFSAEMTSELYQALARFEADLHAVRAYVDRRGDEVRHGGPPAGRAA